MLVVRCTARGGAVTGAHRMANAPARRSPRARSPAAVSQVPSREECLSSCPPSSAKQYWPNLADGVLSRSRWHAPNPPQYVADTVAAAREDGWIACLYDQGFRGAVPWPHPPRTGWRFSRASGRADALRSRCRGSHADPARHGLAAGQCALRLAACLAALSLCRVERQRVGGRRGGRHQAPRDGARDRPGHRRPQPARRADHAADAPDTHDDRYPLRAHPGGVQQSERPGYTGSTRTGPRRGGDPGVVDLDLRHQVRAPDNRRSLGHHGHDAAGGQPESRAPKISITDWSVDRRPVAPNGGRAGRAPDSPDRTLGLCVAERQNWPGCVCLP